MTIATQDLGISPVISEVALSLLGDNIIEFNGQKFEPDDTKGYFKFQISTGFPAGLTTYGTGIYAGVIEKSYKSMLHQNVNYEHRIKSYHNKPGKPNNIEDHVIGSVLAVDFPRANVGAWRLNMGTTQPAITGVAVYHKQTTGMQQIIGNHQTGRHQYTVSMEAQYPFSQAGFAIAMKGDKPSFDSTPEHFAAAGYDFVPVSAAKDELLATFSREKNRIVGKYRSRNTHLLMGGLDNPVHYCGIGVVKYGAESTAKITRLTASDDSIAEPFAELPELLGQALKTMLRQRH